MGEVAKRVTGIVANTAGNIVGPVVSTLMAVGGVLKPNPALAAMAIPAGAAAGSLTEAGVALLGQALQDRANRVGRFAQFAEDASEVSIDELLAAAAANEKLRVLLANSVEAASEAHDDWKIDALARAFVRGADDGAVVDEMMLLVGILRDLEVADVRILAAMYAQDSEIRSQAEDLHARAAMSPEDIQKRDLGLSDSAIAFLLDRLQQARFVRIDQAGHWQLASVGGHVCFQLRDLGTQWWSTDRPAAAE